MHLERELRNVLLGLNCFLFLFLLLIAQSQILNICLHDAFMYHNQSKFCNAPKPHSFSILLHSTQHLHFSFSSSSLPLLHGVSREQLNLFKTRSSFCRAYRIQSDVSLIKPIKLHLAVEPIASNATYLGYLKPTAFTRRISKTT